MGRVSRKKRKREEWVREREKGGEGGEREGGE